MSRIVIRFGIVGPAAGAFGFVLADQLLAINGLIVSTLSQPAAPMSALALATVPILWLCGLLLAYPIGLLPALLTAALYSRAAHTRGITNSGPLARAFAGGILGAGVAAVFAGLFFHRSAASSQLLALVPWATAGALGGALSAIAAGTHRVAEPLGKQSGNNAA